MEKEKELLHCVDISELFLDFKNNKPIKLNREKDAEEKDGSAEES